jgi:hypothetical protein
MTAVGSLRSAELGTFVFSEAAFFESALLGCGSFRTDCAYNVRLLNFATDRVEEA